MTSFAPTLPAVDRLGYALDLSDITPFEIGSVASHVLNQRRLLPIDLSNSREVKIREVTYSVPSNVAVATDNTFTRGEYITFADGKDAASTFMSDASYPLRYFAVSGTTSAAYAAQKSFLAGNQYAFFSFTKGSYSVHLQDYGDSLAEGPLINGIGGLPIPFDPLNEDTVRKYKGFFGDYGSHIIHNVNYGYRYPLAVWSSNVSPEVGRMFGADVKFKFKGIPSGGEFDESIKDQDQFKTFNDWAQWRITVSGGGDSSKLANNTATFEEYMTWVDSLEKYSPSLLGFQVIEVWSLMKYAKSTLLRSYADHLYDAFMWILSHPQVHKTHITLDIQSDWAEFNLLTPSAKIIPDPEEPFPEDTVVSDTRVQWSKEYSHEYERISLRFFVVNDGSPIDFSTSHGSSGGGGSRGYAIVTFEGNTYKNDVITDNVYNTIWFNRAPVNPAIEAKSPTSKAFYSWDEVLEKYLSELAANVQAWPRSTSCPWV